MNQTGRSLTILDPNMGLSPEEFARRDEYQAKCMSCGACCCFYAKDEAGIDADGPAGEDPNLSYYFEETKTWTWPDGDKDSYTRSGMVMRTQTLDALPACIALAGHPGQDVKCTIYENRPQHCQRFVAGSNACLRARRWAGFE